MKARKLLQGASYDPSKLEAIGRAFDEVWASVAARYGTSPTVVEAARLELATAVLQNAPSFWDDIEALKKVALRQLEARMSMPP